MACLLGRGQPRQPKCVLMNSGLLNESEQCEAIILGTLVKALAASNLDRLPDAAFYGGSASGLYELLKGLGSSIHPIRTTHPGSSFQSNHTRCNPASELMADIDKACSSRGSLVTDTHWAHMNAQASKSGVSNTKLDSYKGISFSVPIRSSATTSPGLISNSTTPIFGSRFPASTRAYSGGFPAP